MNTLRDWCWRDRPIFVFLMETKIDSKRLEKVRNKCGSMEGLCTSSERNSGGMGFWWREVNSRVGSYSTHHFEVEVRD